MNLRENAILGGGGAILGPLRPICPITAMQGNARQGRVSVTDLEMIMTGDTLGGGL